MSEESEINWYTNDTATFGDRVAAARENRQLSSKALARRLGVARKTVEGWENDISEPRANKLQMLSGVLNVSIPWLLTGEGDTLEPENFEAAELSEVLLEIRTMRVEMLSGAERLGVLEKRLKKAISG